MHQRINVADCQDGLPTQTSELTWLVPTLLSVVAGMSDTIGFLTLKLFPAHVTGNLVVLSALLIEGAPTNINQILAIPVFLLAVVGVWFIAQVLDKRGADLVVPLLLIHFALLACVLVLSITFGANGPHGWLASIIGMTTISAMACQFALLHLAAPGAPSTAVMTVNLTKTVLFFLDTYWLAKPLARHAREQLKRTSTLVIGFFAGCVAGAVGLLGLRNWSWLLPVAIAGAALALVARKTRWTHALRTDPCSRVSDVRGKSLTLV